MYRSQVVIISLPLLRDSLVEFSRQIQPEIYMRRRRALAKIEHLASREDLSSSLAWPSLALPLCTDVRIYLGIKQFRACLRLYVETAAAATLQFFGCCCCLYVSVCLSVSFQLAKSLLQTISTLPVTASCCISWQTRQSSYSRQRELLEGLQ